MRSKEPISIGDLLRFPERAGLRDAIELAAVISRFWGKVKRGADGGCDLWTGGVNDDGYGIFHVGSIKVYAHRFAWAITKGELPVAFNLLHRCDVRTCVSHTYLGSQKLNMRDRGIKHRIRRFREDVVALSSIGHVTREQREYCAQLALELIDCDYEYAFIASQFGVTPETVGRWVRPLVAARSSDDVDESRIAS